MTSLEPSASGASRYLAATDATAPPCQFEILVEQSQPTSNERFAFANAALIRRPGSDCTAFLGTLAKQLGFAGQLPTAGSTDRLTALLAILGRNQSRSPAGNVEGGFSPSPPGHWMAAKLFVKDGEGEVYLNLDPSEGVGEFSVKDEDYAEIVVTELARILLPKAG